VPCSGASLSPCGVTYRVARGSTALVAQRTTFEPALLIWRDGSGWNQRAVLAFGTVPSFLANERT
jgi:hypothetical protein